MNNRNKNQLYQFITSKCGSAIELEQRKQYNDAYEQYVSLFESIGQGLRLYSQESNLDIQQQLIKIARNCVERCDFLLSNYHQQLKLPMSLNYSQQQQQQQMDQLNPGSRLSLQQLRNESMYKQQLASELINDTNQQQVQIHGAYKKNVGAGFSQASTSEIKQRLEQIDKKTLILKQELDASANLTEQKRTEILKKINEIGSMRSYYINKLKLLEKQEEREKQTERKKKGSSFGISSLRKSFSIGSGESTSSDPFIKKHFKYLDMKNPTLIAIDHKFLSDLKQNPNDEEIVHKHIKRISSESHHAVKKLLDEYAKFMRNEYSIDGVGWVNVNEAVKDIRSFAESVARALSNLPEWQSSYFNTDGIIQVAVEAIVEALGEILYDHLLAMYGMQSQIKEKQKHIPEIAGVSLEELDVAEDLLLTNEESPYELAIFTLNQLNDMRQIDALIEIVSQATRDIFSCINEYWKGKKDISIDDSQLFGVFLYVLLQANIPHLPSILAFINDFADAKRIDSDGEYGFSMLNHTLEWCMSFEFDGKNQASRTVTSNTQQEKQEQDNRQGEDVFEEEEKKAPLSISTSSSDLDLLQQKLRALRSDNSPTVSPSQTSISPSSYSGGIYPKFEHDQEEISPESGGEERTDLQSQHQNSQNPAKPFKRRPLPQTPPQLTPKSPSSQVTPNSPGQSSTPLTPQHETTSIENVTFSGTEFPDQNPQVQSLQQYASVSNPSYGLKSVQDPLVLPFSFSVVETVQMIIDNNTGNIQSYEFAGTIGVSCDSTADLMKQKFITFQLVLRNAMKTCKDFKANGQVAKILPNNDSTSNLSLKCKITSQQLQSSQDKGEIQLLKYTLQYPTERPVYPVRLNTKIIYPSLSQPDRPNVADLLIQYGINPSVYSSKNPMQQLSLLVQPIMETIPGASNLTVEDIKVNPFSQEPNVTFSREKQYLEWIIKDAIPTTPTQSASIENPGPGKLLVNLSTSGEIPSGVVPGTVRCIFGSVSEHHQQQTLSDLSIEGTCGKASSHGLIFSGGMKYLSKGNCQINSK